MGSYSENSSGVGCISSQQPPPQIRSLEKTLEEAASTGTLRLSGRKLKEISLKLLQKYDLSDTIIADLSKNRLSELPAFVCELYLLSELSLYSNLLRSLPSDGSLLTLQNLTYLNLSKNQVSVIPQALCELPKLQVLIVSHNRLCSLPEELGHMASLSDLDVSCNEISFLPAQIGDLVSLKYLDLRRNFLVELPVDICDLQGLTRLDVSENRIQTLPSQMRHMALTEFFCDHNPLITPPAALCTRGLNHVKKYLENEDRKRGGASTAQSDTGTITNGRGTIRQRDSLRLTGLRCYGGPMERKSVDSVNEKNFSLMTSAKDDKSSTDEIRRFAAQRMEFARSPKKSQFQEATIVTTPSSDGNTLQEGIQTPTTLSPSAEFVPIPSSETCLLLGAESNLTPEEEFRQRHEAIVTRQRTEALKRAQKEAVMAFVKQRQVPVAPQLAPPHPQQPPPPPPCPPPQASPTCEIPPPLPNFTIRRGLDRAREEQELLQRMRQIIESRLKVSLPDNLAGALADGVVLCHLANNVRPRSVATIHVPSSATPKLTMAKCRRNVENFLDACRRLGVPSDEVCECGDILAEFDAQALMNTIESFLRVAKAKPMGRPPPPPPVRDTSLQPQAVNNNTSIKRDEDQQHLLGDGCVLSRNDSPVSTSEDISNLENLEYDPSDVRSSSTPRTLSGQNEVKSLPQDDENVVDATFKSVCPKPTKNGTSVKRLRNVFEAEKHELPLLVEETTNQQMSLNVKAGAAAATAVILTYLYYCHPYILMVLVVAVLYGVYKFFTKPP